MKNSFQIKLLDVFIVTSNIWQSVCVGRGYKALDSTADFIMQWGLGEMRPGTGPFPVRPILV